MASSIAALMDGVDSVGKTGFLGKLEQQLERFVRYAILGVIEVEAHCFCTQTVAAPGIVSEQLPQM